MPFGKKINQGETCSFPFTHQLQLPFSEETTVKVWCIQIFLKMKITYLCIYICIFIAKEFYYAIAFHLDVFTQLYNIELFL